MFLLQISSCDDSIPVLIEFQERLVYKCLSFRVELSLFPIFYPPKPIILLSWPLKTHQNSLTHPCLYRYNLEANWLPPWWSVPHSPSDPQGIHCGPPCCFRQRNLRHGRCDLIDEWFWHLGIGSGLGLWLKLGNMGIISEISEEILDWAAFSI